MTLEQENKVVDIISSLASAAMKIIERIEALERKVEHQAKLIDRLQAVTTEVET